MPQSHLLLIGGRSGVGKSTTAFAIHDELSRRGFMHAVIEGDLLDLAHPARWKHQLAEQNLAAIWANYKSLGYRHLIYTNTVSILEAETLSAAMGDAPVVTTVLLTATDETIERRLAFREQGESLKQHVQRSMRIAPYLEEKANSETHRVPTDQTSSSELAHLIISLTGWVLED